MSSLLNSNKSNNNTISQSHTVCATAKNRKRSTHRHQRAVHSAFLGVRHFQIRKALKKTKRTYFRYENTLLLLFPTAVQCLFLRLLFLSTRRRDKKFHTQKLIIPLLCSTNGTNEHIICYLHFGAIPYVSTRVCIQNVFDR